MRDLDEAAEAMVDAMHRKAARNSLDGAIAHIISTHAIDEALELLGVALDSIREAVGE